MVERTFSKIKDEIRHIKITDPLKESKYGRFLDKIGYEDDASNWNELGDLWHFSNNTEFCKRSARYFLDELEKQFDGFLKWQESLKEFKFSETHGFHLDRPQQLFGSFCFYVYSTLESFAHEINLFYELNEDRENISIKRMSRKLIANGKGQSSLVSHLQIIESDTDLKHFFAYRNAIMHGYIYPIRFDLNGFYVKENPKRPLFSFEGMNLNLLLLSREVLRKVDNWICLGWRCFEKDELS